MPFSIAMIGAGQFAGSFAHLFHLHPGVTEVYADGHVPERADELVASYGLAGTFPCFEEVLASPGGGCRGDLHPALDPRSARGAGPARRQARLLRRADGDQRRGDRGDHRGGPGDRADLHDG